MPYLYWTPQQLDAMKLALEWLVEESQRSHPHAYDIATEGTCRTCWKMGRAKALLATLQGTATSV